MKVNVSDIVITWDRPINRTGSNATIYVTDPNWLAAYYADLRRKAFARRAKRQIGWRAYR